MNKPIKTHLKALFNKAAPAQPPELQTATEHSAFSTQHSAFKKRRSIIYHVAAVAAAFALIAAGLGYFPILRQHDEEDPGPSLGAMNVAAVGNTATLKKLLKGSNNYYGGNRFFSLGGGDEMAEDAEMPASAPPTGQNSNEAKGSSSAKDDHSTTNLQVEGVDEADIIKTDGEFVYYLANNSLYIADIRDPRDMTIVTKMKYDNWDNPNNSRAETPIEMYVDGDILTVIFTVYEWDNSESDKRQYYYYDNSYSTRVRVFDMADRADIRQTRDFSFDGYYSTSRKVGDLLYVIGYKGTYYYPYETDVFGNEIYPPIASVLPKCRAENGGWEAVALDTIRYFTEVEDNNIFQYIIGMDVKNPDAEVKTNIFLNNGNTVYANAENIYIAGVKYSYDSEEWWQSSCDTIVSKFTLNGGEVLFDAMGTVPGNVLNQFSMDAYTGNFRIATTVDRWSPDGENHSANNLYILGPDMKIIGKLTGLAPGERIYSVRFIGPKVYMVTFRTVDPLFVIDAEDPANPQVLGELKIPGYSSYLHPYDETHIIGFGMDAEEVDKDLALRQGIKIAMFDVSDFHNPKELFNTAIGKRGSYSELLDNHKALLFSKEKNIFAFPAVVCREEYSEGWQGFLYFSIDMEEGFVEKGRISHAGAAYNTYWDYYGSEIAVTRGIYAGDVLYTFSGAKIMAHSLVDMAFIGELKIN
ncbi:MAG: beta-propeller domain-containing protein [Oscillospiraceae bacterium]|nr:beta-propeller domain-containing protein [Oscillospiraceae bacterium]